MWYKRMSSNLIWGKINNMVVKLKTSLFLSSLKADFWQMWGLNWMSTSVLRVSYVRNLSVRAAMPAIILNIAWNLVMCLRQGINSLWFECVNVRQERWWAVRRRNKLFHALMCMQINTWHHTYTHTNTGCSPFLLNPHASKCSYSLSFVGDSECVKLHQVTGV